MTRTASKITLSIGLSAALALPGMLAPSLAMASEGDDSTVDPSGDPATSAPVVIVAPAPPPPPPPPAPIIIVDPVVSGSGAPSNVIVDPRVAELRHQRNSGLGMTISGYTMFGTSYLISALIGTISLDYAEDIGGSGMYGKRMTIPLVGPFMAISRSDSATGGLFTGLLGVVQVGGLVLGTTGAIRFGRSRRQLALSANSGGLQLQF